MSSAWSLELAVGQRTKLPLIRCPICHKEDVIELVCRNGENKGKVFFKCPLNDKDDPTSCGFFKNEMKYRKTLETNGASCSLTITSSLAVASSASAMEIEPIAGGREVGNLLGNTSDAHKLEADIAGPKANSGRLESEIDALKVSADKLDAKIVKVASNVEKLMRDVKFLFWMQLVNLGLSFFVFLVHLGVCVFVILYWCLRE